MVTKRARVTGVAVLALTFLVGALVGAATLQVVSGDTAPTARHSSGGPNEADFLEQLGLAAEQREQVDRILERRREQMAVYRPLLRAIGDSARADIRDVLTPAQRVLEEEFRARRRAYYEKQEKERNRDGK